MSEYTDYQKMSNVQLEDLMQSTVNSLHKLTNKKRFTDSKMEKFTQTRREQLEEVLTKAKNAYAAKGQDPEEYTKGVMENIKRREEKSIEDRDDR